MSMKPPGCSRAVLDGGYIVDILIVMSVPEDCLYYGWER